MIVGAPGDEPLEARARQVYDSAIVIDTHNDLPSKIVDDGYDPDVRHPAGFAAPVSAHTDLPRLIESGLTATFLAAFVDAPYSLAEAGASCRRAVHLIDAAREFVARHPTRMRLATRGADVRQAKEEGMIAVFMAVEGGHAIENSLDRLRDLYDRGARSMTLTWNNGTEWAGAAIGLYGTNTGGLSRLGRDVVREMNRLGMLVDLSHVSPATMHDAIETSTDPVIASHSSARALCDHPRNLSDDQLRAVASTGGVVNVNFFSEFLDSAFDPVTGTAAVTLDCLVDHIEHVALVAGVDHVGIGSDFDGATALPSGMEDVTCLKRLAPALMRRGFGEADVAKILGWNMLRVIEHVLDRTPG